MASRHAGLGRILPFCAHTILSSLVVAPLGNGRGLTPLFKMVACRVFVIKGRGRHRGRGFPLPVAPIATTTTTTTNDVASPDSLLDHDVVFAHVARHCLATGSDLSRSASSESGFPPPLQQRFRRERSKTKSINRYGFGMPALSGTQMAGRAV